MPSKRSDAEIIAILSEWRGLQKTGLTQRKYAAQKGLSVRTLRSWQARYHSQSDNADEVVKEARRTIERLTLLVASLERHGISNKPKTSNNVLPQPMGLPHAAMFF